jgi:c-di-GMP-binding flagellar brake protein YcgR
MALFGKKRPKGEERRKYIRLDAHHLLKYKIVGKGEELSFAKNISAGGVLFIAKENIPTDSVIELEINFPTFPHPIKAKARVVWNRELKKFGGFETGAEFINVDEDAKEFINKKITSTSEKLEQ